MERLILKFSKNSLKYITSYFLLTYYNMFFKVLQCFIQAVSIQFGFSIMADSLQPHGLQHTVLPCPSPTPGSYSNSCPFSQRCHPTISFSVIPFPSCLQSFPASGSFPVSHFFTSGDQSIGFSASASIHPMNIQD